MASVPFDKLGGKLWYNGEMVEWDEGRLHILSHGLHYGSCVFEGERAYGGKIFKHQEHTDRLFKSAEILGMDIGYSNKQLYDAAYASLAAQGFTDAYVRPVAWRGSEMMAISAQQTKTHVAVICWDMGSYFDPEARMAGIKLQWAKYKRPSPECAPVHAKAAGLYMICTVSKHEAEAQGFNDAIMLDWRGYIAECTGANIFFVKNGALHTPTPDCFLDGITRRTVIERAKVKGIEVVERHILPEELAEMQEVFIVGTAAEVTPINQIGDMNFQVGEVTRDLLTDYHNHVRGL
ncbi:MAG: branched-chain amino acid aminotransferase [Rhodospirillaceae bacterium]|nr:MAG: branched-chain amino acid aminotransferase [Rhodospirillaceae bacterium]